MVLPIWIYDETRKIEKTLYTLLLGIGLAIFIYYNMQGLGWIFILTYVLSFFIISCIIIIAAGVRAGPYGRVNPIAVAFTSLVLLLDLLIYSFLSNTIGNTIGIIIIIVIDAIIIFKS